MKISFSSDTPTVYLGATDLETEGDWIWDFSRENMANTYSAWARKQPDNTNKREHYLAYVAFYGGWVDYVIDGGTANWPDHYICERGESECNIHTKVGAFTVAKGGR